MQMLNMPKMTEAQKAPAVHRVTVCISNLLPFIKVIYLFVFYFIYLPGLNRMVFCMPCQESSQVFVLYRDLQLDLEQNLVQLFCITGIGSTTTAPLHHRLCFGALLPCVTAPLLFLDEETAFPADCSGLYLLSWRMIPYNLLLIFPGKFLTAVSYEMFEWAFSIPSF